jgi:heme exporter protein CcmD
MSEFLAMGGYAWYVWMAYGAGALAVVIEVAAVRARRKRAFDELRMSATPPRPSMLGARGIR